MFKGTRAKIVAGAVLLGLLGSVSGCTSEISAPTAACSPTYKVNSKYGLFEVQQKGKGKTIAWGAYPAATYSGTRYQAVVTVAGIKKDTKDQAYAPHGSISAGTALKYSGKLFRVTGSVTKGKDIKLGFEMQCTIA